MLATIGKSANKDGQLCNIMPRKLLKRFLPNAQTIKSHRWLRPIDQFLHQENLWHIHQRNIAKATFIGIFVAFLPLPGHTLIAALLAILFSANLVASIAVAWIINNPLTMGPLFYLDYYLGARVLGSHLKHVAFEPTWEWLYEMAPKIGIESLLGSFICGLSLGFLGYWAVRFIWRWKVLQMWRQRTLNRGKP